MTVLGEARCSSASSVCPLLRGQPQKEKQWGCLQMRNPLGVLKRARKKNNAWRDDFFEIHKFHGMGCPTPPERLPPKLGHQLQGQASLHPSGRHPVKKLKGMPPALTPAHLSKPAGICQMRERERETDRFIQCDMAPTRSALCQSQENDGEQMRVPQGWFPVRLKKQ